MSRKQWVRGDQAKIARVVGISRQHLSNLLGRRCRAKADQAAALEKAALELGYAISRYDWIYTIETDNVLFKDK